MGEERRLEKEVILDAMPEEVWEAIATGPGLASWFMEMEIPSGEGGTSPLGTVTAWEPGKHLAVRALGPEGATRAFEYWIEAADGGRTVLRFVQSGFQGDSWEAEYDGFSHGWDMYFHTLAQYLRHFAGGHATYILAVGPASSARNEPWPALLRGLGLNGTVSEGDAVRLTPDGLVPIEGVVDYARPTFFLGVRTADGLYRFHVRAAVGMPVAVGHHLFSDDVDRTRSRAAWRSWLDRLYVGSD